MRDANKEVHQKELSREKTREGKENFALYLQLRAKLAEVEQTIERLEKQTPGWKPLKEKSALAQAYDLESDINGGLEYTSSQVVIALSKALELDPNNREAREVLSDYYWRRLQEAEHTDYQLGVDYYTNLLVAYDDSKYAAQIHGGGYLGLESNPSGAEVWIADLVQNGFVRSETNLRQLGTTPIEPIMLPMGSYVLIIRKGGYQDTRYPVFISRNRDWRGTINLYTNTEIGDNFVYVPAGPFIQGGDKQGTHGWALPKQETWVDDFFIAKYPVTLEEYLVFLNDRTQIDAEQAQQHCPRRLPNGGYYLSPDSDGMYHLPTTADGGGWKARMPVLSISFFDAEAYCNWLSLRHGRTYRLPTEAEWEKAARGVDGSYRPWGNRFDPCLCNMRDSREAGPGPVTVDEFPTDVSVYGVYGMAGNVRDWTTTQVNEGEGLAPELGFQSWIAAEDTRIVKGGAWSPLRPHLADRYGLPPTLVMGFIGFRIAAVPSNTTALEPSGTEREL